MGPEAQGVDKVRHPAFQKCRPRAAKPEKPPEADWRTNPSACQKCAGLGYRRPEKAPCPGCGGPYVPAAPLPRPDAWARGISPLGRAETEAQRGWGIGGRLSGKGVPARSTSWERRKSKPAGSEGG